MFRKLILSLLILLAILTDGLLANNSLIGYWHNWDNSSSPYVQIKDVDSNYNVIVVSFALPTSNTDMTMYFNPEVVSKAELKSQIATAKSKGKKVLISVGGATSYIDINNNINKSAFINSMNDIISTYDFDGLDIDIEHGNSILINNGGTISNPANQSMINLIDAIKDIMTSFRAKYSKKLYLTMAPETAYVQGGMSAFGSIWGGYLPIIHTLRDSIDILQVQLYNSGSMYGIDGNIYNQGTEDFIVAMTEASINGFNTAGGMFTGLPASKVAVGLPACVSAAGGGFVDTTKVRKAINYLIGKGSKPGSYTLKNSNGYSNLLGMMTWSINWDAVNNCGGIYEFANNYNRLFKPVINQISCTAQFTQICQNSEGIISFIATGNYNQGNIFKAELSSSSGSFTNPIVIGSISSTISNNINIKIPNTIAPANGYRIRVVSSNPVITGSDNGTNITVNALPNLDYTPKTSVCEFSSATYTTTTETGIDYLWNVSGGTIQNSNISNSIVVKWGGFGIGTIKLIKSSTVTGCKDSVVNTITINELPKPAIFGDTNVCKNSIAKYYTTSKANTSNYWTVGNGKVISSNQGDTILVQWDSTENCKLNLAQLNSRTGCETIVSKNIKVTQLPTPKILGSQNVNKGASEIYFANSESINSKWIVSGGVISSIKGDSVITVTWGNSGIGKVKLIQTSLNSVCIDSTETEVTINPNQLNIMGANKVCENSSVDYTANSNAGTDSKWEVLSGGEIIGSNRESIVRVKWNTAGKGELLLLQNIKNTNLEDTAKLTVKINSLPEVRISGKEEVQFNETTKYKTNSVDSFANVWTVVNGEIVGDAKQDSIEVLWNKVGKSLVRLIATDKLFGCSDSTTLEIKVNPVSKIEEIIKQEDKSNDNVQVFNNIVLLNTNNYDSMPYEILNLLGFSCQKASIENRKLDISELPAGIYFLKINNNLFKFLKY